METDAAAAALLRYRTSLSTGTRASAMIAGMTDPADGIGTLATGTLLAREVERAHHGAPAVGHAADEPCANCGARRHGAFCHECGQAGHVHRDLGALVHDIAHGVFHFEGKIWQTLPLLLRRPGELTRRYVAGERAKFVSPVALFLFAVFLMFASISSVGHHGGSDAGQLAKASSATASERGKVEAKLATYRSAYASVPSGRERERLGEKITDAEQEVAALKAVEAGTARLARARSGEEAGHGPQPAAERPGPGQIDTGWAWLDEVGRHASENPKLTEYKLKTYAYKYSWALIPISLPFIWLLFAWRRDVGLYDHAIFAIYSLSFMALGVTALVLLSAAGVTSLGIALAVMLVPPWHMYRQLKGAYRLGRLGALWRTAALLLITAVTSGLFFAFLVYMGSS